MDSKDEEIHIHHIVRHLEIIYPEADSKALAEKAMDAFGVGHKNAKPRYSSLWDQRDAIMITYGDSLLLDNQRPLRTLKHFLDHHMKETLNGVHILPFCPFI